MEAHSSLADTLLDCSLSYSNSLLDTNLLEDLDARIPCTHYRVRRLSKLVPLKLAVIELNL